MNHSEELKPSLINPFSDMSYGWIQWKGTNVCVDIHCSCGEFCHYDGGFMYYLTCPNCQQMYEVNGHILLHPIETREETCNVIPEQFSDYDDEPTFIGVRVEHEEENSSIVPQTPFNRI